MLEQFEAQYMELHWHYNQILWNHYFNEGHDDLNQIDEKIYQLVSHFKDKIKNKNRKSLIANLIIAKNLVEKDKDVSRLRNKLDEWNNYNQSIPSHLSINEKKEIIAKRMRQDVLHLMELRNRKSIDMGYKSYPDLIMTHDELDLQKVICLLKKYLDANLSYTKELIKKYNFCLDTWFQDLNKLKTNISYQPYELTKRFIQSLGFQSFRVNIDVKPSKILGMASNLGENDIRINLNAIHSLSDVSTLFHELGHALYYYYIEEKGLYQVLPPSLDEVTAVIVETIAPIVLLHEEEMNKIEDIRTLEHTRIAISALFEFELWNNPQHAEALYKQYYEQLGIPVKTPSIWAIDSFRSIDPVYIHHYVLGATLGDEIKGFFIKHYQHDYKLYGKWLVKNIFQKGRKMRIPELLSRFNL